MPQKWLVLLIKAYSEACHSMSMVCDRFSGSKTPFADHILYVQAAANLDPSTVDTTRVTVVMPIRTVSCDVLPPSLHAAESSLRLFLSPSSSLLSRLFSVLSCLGLSCLAL